MEDEILDLSGAANQCRQFFDEFREALAEKLVLSSPVVEQSLIGLLSGGHLLLEGHPGMGKRTLAATLARLSGLSFSAALCTPDLTPTDLGGSEQLREDAETGRRRYQFVPGPLFANLAYTGDLHRAPPRCLALLVDSMQSRQVAHGQEVADLPTPFVLVASVAPDLEDTEMALDASVTDRFLLQLSFAYPSGLEEWAIGRLAGSQSTADRTLISAEELKQLQDAAARVAMPDDVLGYAWALARATRPGNELAPDFVETWIHLGISPQGLTSLVSAAKARAILHGRVTSTRRDVYEVVQPVFRHRLRSSEEALAAGLDVDRILRMLLERISFDEEYRPEGDL